MEATPEAVHLPDGNRFADMRVDIAASIAAQERWIAQLPKRSLRHSLVGNYARLAAYVALRRMRLWEPAVNAGLIREWFDEFSDYWSRSLGGRRLTIMDFHQMRFLFRKRFARLGDFSWDTNDQHLANWQRPENIHATFHFLYREALEPVRSRELFAHLRSGMRVLEYGCSLAPMYRTWRSYLSHVRTQWVLADIANFPFHYSRHTYAQDAEASFCLITEELFDDPLRPVDGNFDIIIIHEVFEHLHKPRHVAEYLLRRLKPGGLFFFDYMRSDATGHDTPAGLAERTTTLKYLEEKLQMIDGRFEVSERSLGRCIGRLKAPATAAS
ncbi:MAG TPA: methyltransferase domain-containing protein [Chthoniobacter sp.]|jgi:2-polyprenyl-3-methyl-5-hydroxy-6-metoxy-1,4-benzoquinol methylase